MVTLKLRLTEAMSNQIRAQADELGVSLNAQILFLLKSALAEDAPKVAGPKPPSAADKRRKLKELEAQWKAALMKAMRVAGIGGSIHDLMRGDDVRMKREAPAEFAQYENLHAEWSALKAELEGAV